MRSTNVCVFFTYFNPRSREGSDLYFMDKLTEQQVFQSTLP